MEENKRGGKRDGAGRKPLPVMEKKSVLTLYPNNETILKFGGKKQLTEKLLIYMADYGKEDKSDIGVYDNFKDLTRPTHEIKPFEQPKSNFEVKIPPQPISSVTGNIEAFKQKILKTTTIQEIEAVMREVKSSLMFPKDKQALELFAKAHSKDFFND